MLSLNTGSGRSRGRKFAHKYPQSRPKKCYNGIVLSMLLSGGKRILAAKVDGDPAFFGEWLKHRRQELDLTQIELAQSAGCSAAGLRKIETGERRPSKELAALLAAALGIAPDKRATFVRVARGELNLERLGPVSTERAASRPLSAALPVWPTPFLGRTGELNALGELLLDPNCRLLTIIGPGGIGKTRLAAEVAGQVIDRFADGACFVPLAQQSSPTFLIPAMADALGISLQGQTDAQTQLLNHLRTRQLLLIVDNMEHLLAGVPLLAAIIAHSPGVRLLVTSRERLNLMGEWIYELEGLPVPAGDETSQPESYVSVALFIQNARRASANFTLHEGDLACIAGICRLLEGTPLGIELAAAWVAALSPCEIADQIEKSFDFLTTTLRDVPDRQRSLRAAFEYSWNLLPLDERCALSRLAVFRGGFDHAAAEQVSGASLTILLALISKSLIRRRESSRFDMHEVVRQFALASLFEDADADTISLGLNFLAPTAMRLGHYEQAVAWLEESIALSSELGDRWGLGTAWRQYGAVELARGNIEAAKTHLAQSLEAYRGFVTGYDLLHTNIHLGECALAEGDETSANCILTEALRQTSAEGIQALVMQAMVGLVELDLRRGHYDRALGLAVAVMNQSVTNHEMRTRAAAIRQAAMNHLGQAQIAAAEEWGQELSLKEMVKIALGD